MKDPTHSAFRVPRSAFPSSLSRREFIGLSAASATAFVAGCATNPVTGRRQLMFVSEAEEVKLDRTWAPHQFSADYGAVTDDKLNGYVRELGMRMGHLTHRPHMPYSFRVVGSPVVNAYTFPGGSVAAARGLMLRLGSEAELAAVLGHELGHVNARHAGARMTQGILAQLAVVGVAAYVQREEEKYAGLAAGLGMIGSQLLLSRYSRENEREADALGMEYAARAELNPGGMVGVMETFLRLHKSEPGAVELLFATHPLSEERRRNAVEALRAKYAYAAGYPDHRERYMDRTAGLRAMRGAIERMEKGERAMMARKYAEAESLLKQALDAAPGDYAARLMLAKCHLTRENFAEAERLASAARAVCPAEPQAWHVAGMAKIRRRRFEAALQDFSAYEEKLPGNPNTVFLRGFCSEGMGRRPQAARAYGRYLQAAPGGEHAAHARGRLVEWGYIKPAAAGGAVSR